jgi:hypothetical protein
MAATNVRRRGTIHPPLIENDPSLWQAQEQLPVKQLVPQPAVDAFHGLCPLGRPGETPRVSPVGMPRILLGQTGSTVCLGGIATRCHCFLVCLDGHEDCVQRVEDVGIASVKGFRRGLDLGNCADCGL